MKIQGFRYALWGINLIIVIGIGLALTLLIVRRGLSSQDVAKELDAAAARVLSKPSQSVGDGLKANQIDVFWKSPIRAKVPDPIVDNSQKPSHEGPPATTPLDRQLLLSGVLGTEVILTYLDPALSATKPTPKKDKEQLLIQKNVSMDSVVPDIKPEAIPIRFEYTPYPGRVVFRYDNKEVSLPIVRESGSEASTAAGAGAKKGPGGFAPNGVVPPTGRVPGANPLKGGVNEDGEPIESQPEDEALAEAREVSPGQWELPASEREYLQQNSRTILDQIGMEDYNEGSERGIKLTSLGDSYPAKYGFQEGDIIKSVNGTPITSQSSLIDFAKKQGDRTKMYRVDYYRQGKLMSSTFRLK